MWVMTKRALFTILRVWLGLQWFQAGVGKVGNPVWTGDKAGVAITGFANGAIAKAAGDNPSVQKWFANFLQAAVLPNVKLFGYLVAWGEVLVGVGLILGALTGFAALAGAFMNLNFLLAGTVSSNPILLTASFVIILAIAHAEYFAVDAYIRPRVEKAANDGLQWVKAQFQRTA